MKKIFLISVFLMFALSYGYSQTYYYKRTALILNGGPNDGVRQKTKGGHYITFINNKASCYESDKNGNAIGSHGSYPYKYIKTQNGTHVYQSTNMFGGGDSYYFNSDFSKFIIQMGTGGYGFSVECIKTNGPQDDYDDSIPTF